MARAPSFPLSLPVAMLLTGTLSACGQSGRLYHPDEPPPHTQRRDTLGFGEPDDGPEAPGASGELGPAGAPAGAEPPPATPSDEDDGPQRKQAKPPATP